MTPSNQTDTQYYGIHHMLGFSIGLLALNLYFAIRYQQYCMGWLRGHFSVEG
jgi:hypothetical protein